MITNYVPAVAVFRDLRMDNYYSCPIAAWDDGQPMIMHPKISHLVLATAVDDVWLDTIIGTWTLSQAQWEGVHEEYKELAEWGFYKQHQKNDD